MEALHRAGQRALLAEFASPADVLAFHRQLSATPLPGQLEAVPAARTVLVAFRTRQQAREAQRQLRRIRPKAGASETGREIELRVHYDGADLDSAAEHLGLSPQGLIDWHSSTRWAAAFGGFAPGFTYCLPEQLVTRRRPRKSGLPGPVPRLETPRTVVPAGAVGLAGEFSAAYPRSSPGGWQLIGTTDAALWDISRPEPALIRAGDTVRYRPVAERITVSAGAQQPAPVPPVPATDVVLEVLSPGPQTLLQDLGRPGHSELGVPRSGAADLQALRQVNQLVGNPQEAVGFEVLHGGLELAVHQISVLAVTGAESRLQISTPSVPETSNMASHGVPGPEQIREVPLRAPFLIYPGERLRLSAPSRGLRSYVAVSGGLAAPAVLGSSATDLLSGLGPAPVSAGQCFALVGAPSGFVGIADVARTALPEPGIPTTLRFVPGPREEWFASKHSNPGLAALQSMTWTVSEDSNRVGTRLRAAHPEDPDGPEHSEPPVQRTRQEELPSEPVVRGSIQIPPSGEPMVFLADHPVTGGYPVIGVVVREDLGLAAQLPPGHQVRFQAVEPYTLDPL
ncbi:5-oxoprolinase subunit B/C family protein [Nesterenkonia ebinurensis]|uniref:5-oxoprolinase subunit B/C family protein n=1 Tax=Nesterenkonia ebinurensis TaxID=2608252 RepID=UPI00123D6F11|nr:urea amidolyase family protein [Nesterenkonia ebinurensis]